MYVRECLRCLTNLYQLELVKTWTVSCYGIILIHNIYKVKDFITEKHTSLSPSSHPALILHVAFILLCDIIPPYTRGLWNTRLYTDNGITPQFSSSWPLPQGLRSLALASTAQGEQTPSLFLSPLTPVHSNNSLCFSSSTSPITQCVKRIGLFLWKYETAYHKFNIWHEMDAEYWQ